MQKNKQSIIKGIVFSFLAILLFFLLLEGICRIGMTCRYKNIYFLKYGASYFSPVRLRNFSNNEQDYRTYNYSIAVFGGSIVYGWELKRNETFPAQLETILNERFATNRIRVSDGGKEFAR